MNYLVITLAFIIILLLWLFYTYYWNASLTKGVASLKTSTDIDWKYLENPSSYQYDYEGWLFINDTTNDDRIIFKRGNDFQAVLNQTTLKLIFNSGSTSAATVTITPNFPLQKWVYFVFNINNNIVEGYLNGKLVQTVQLPQTPKIGQTKLTVGSNINGYISGFRRSPSVLATHEIWQKYTSASGLEGVNNFFASYHIDLALLKNNVQQKELRLL